MGGSAAFSQDLLDGPEWAETEPLGRLGAVLVAL